VLFEGMVVGFTRMFRNFEGPFFFNGNFDVFWQLWLWGNIERPFQVSTTWVLLCVWFKVLYRRPLTKSQLTMFNAFVMVGVVILFGFLMYLGTVFPSSSWTNVGIFGCTPGSQGIVQRTGADVCLSGVSQLSLRTTIWSINLAFVSCFTISSLYAVMTTMSALKAADGQSEVQRILVNMLKFILLQIIGVSLVLFGDAVGQMSRYNFDAHPMGAWSMWLPLIASDYGGLLASVGQVLSLKASTSGSRSASTTSSSSSSSSAGKTQLFSSTHSKVAPQ